jgi:hypothetical protein
MLSRLQIDPSAANNMGIQTVLDLLIDNRIPPSWIDHAYTFGLNFINFQYRGSVYVTFFDDIDNERIARIHAYGIPTPIPEWDGWRHPTDEDMRRIHQLVAYRSSREAPGYDHRLERGWTRVGETGTFAYLYERAEAAAQRYRETHPIQLPVYPSLDQVPTTPHHVDTTMSTVGTTDDTASAAGGAPMEVEASTNFEATPLGQVEEHSSGADDMATGDDGATPTQHPPQDAST